MSPVVGVHGIFNISYFHEAEGDLAAATAAISAVWGRAVAQGLGGYDPAVPVPESVPVAYYADVLDRGVRMGVTEPELLDPFEQRLFVEWVEELRREAVGQEAKELVAEGQLTKWLLRQPAQWLTENLGDLAVREVCTAVRELATYFASAERAAQARRRIVEALTWHRPRVLVAHSLGSVVAYETLCARPDVGVEVFVTLGSPLAMRKVVFDRLTPRPFEKGIRPPGVRQWVNIADRGDFVAVPVGRLGDRFEGVDLDLESSIHILDPHTARSYLRCPEFARTIAPYL